jgi:hypothetical protein
MQRRIDMVKKQVTDIQSAVLVKQNNRQAVQNYIRQASLAAESAPAPATAQ